MHLQIFTIRDRALGAYMQPWCAQSIGLALRMFQDELANEQGQMHKHPDDYDLYHVGTFEDDIGHIVPLEAPKQIATGRNTKQA